LVLNGSVASCAVHAGGSGIRLHFGIFFVPLYCSDLTWFPDSARVVVPPPPSHLCPSLYLAGCLPPFDLPHPAFCLTCSSLLGLDTHIYSTLFPHLPPIFVACYLPSGMQIATPPFYHYRLSWNGFPFIWFTWRILHLNCHFVLLRHTRWDLLPLRLVLPSRYHTATGRS